MAYIDPDDISEPEPIGTGADHSDEVDDTAAAEQGNHSGHDD